MLIFFDRVDWEQIVKVNNATENSATESLNATQKQAASDAIEHRRELYLIVYSCIIIYGIFAYLGRSFTFYRMCLRISINLHDMLFRGVTRAKMLFFNNNPSGRILNRFARDIYHIDSLLPENIFEVIEVSRWEKVEIFLDFVT